MRPGPSSKLRVLTRGRLPPEVGPLARLLPDHPGRRLACDQRFVVENQRSWKGTHLFPAALLDLVHEGRRADHGVVLEQKARDTCFPRGGAQKIRKRRAKSVSAIAFCGPAKLAKDRSRVEDVPAGTV